MKNELKSVFPKELYHSYIIEGDVDVLVHQLQHILEERGDIIPLSPDLFSATYDAFTIADSATIKEWHNSYSIGEGKKVCIIGAKFVNHEAQQSLLKILEEPHENTHFFLVVPQASLLLETIQSRTHTIEIRADSAQVRLVQSLLHKSDLCRVFISSPVPKRLELIALLIEKYKDSVGSGAVRHEATVFINELEEYVYDKFKKDSMSADAQFSLGELAHAREYLSTSGASVKMILEHLALVI